jgi:hypothetical protein
MILVYVTQEATESEIPPLLKIVGMAIEILETMDECVVAARAAQMLHRASESAEKKFSSTAVNTAAANTSGLAPLQSHEAMLQLNQHWAPLNMVDGEMELELSFFPFADWDGGSSLLAMGEAGLDTEH